MRIPRTKPALAPVERPACAAEVVVGEEVEEAADLVLVAKVDVRDSALGILMEVDELDLSRVMLVGTLEDVFLVVTVEEVFVDFLVVDVVVALDLVLLFEVVVGNVNTTFLLVLVAFLVLEIGLVE
jgi:hypothetical protein